MRDIINKLNSSDALAAGVLFLATILALIFANTPILSDFYDSFVHFKFSIGVVRDGHIDENIHFWINDALMAIFFFMVGLELKKEILEGALSEFKKVLVPVFAAIGGVIFPALIFILINLGDSTAIKGWSIPMATDIAFAIGIFALLSKNLPSSLRIFLLTLAIVDDLFAILVIAIFYTHNINFMYLSFGLFIFLIMILMNKKNVDNKIYYIVLGIFLWFCILNSGIHATLAGVLIAFSIPLYSKKKQPIVSDMEHALKFPVNYIVLPLFAFVNAGVVLSQIEINQIFNTVPMGIFFGLFIGKQIGIFLFTFLSVKLGFGNLPDGANYKHIYIVAILCGIGFTMSLFISNLAYDEQALKLYSGTEKLAILCGSFLSGIVAFILGKRA